MPAPIIAAYSPYAEDRAPVTLAIAAAKLTGSPVVAAAVYPWTMTEGFSDPYTLDAETQQIVHGALQRLHEDLGVETTIVHDLSVPRGLHQFAREKEAGLIVVGSTARGRTGRVLTGSTAERLLRGSPCAIALAPTGYQPTGMATIAVGFVDSPEGHEALAAAHALAVRSGARLRVVAVLHPSGGLDAAMASGLRPQRSIMLQGRHRREIQAALDRQVAALTPAVDVDSEVHVDDPAEVLLRVSERVDLLVCGSRGYGPLRSVVLGGVSRRLVDEARCPVLVLPREVGLPLDDLIGDTTAATAR
jgi:nucleotide-binding universal stress UspA family protein